MANNCYTTYKIIGDESAMNNLIQSLNDLNNNNTMYIQLSDLAKRFNINTEKRCISVRGKIYFYELDDNVLTIETETDWVGCHDLFNAINKKLNNKLSISYREIEPGCNIFNVHDDNAFFTEKYYITYDGDEFDGIDSDYFDDIDDIIDIWCEKMGIERCNRTAEYMLTLIQNFEYEYADTYFEIHLFNFQ